MIQSDLPINQSVLNTFKAEWDRLSRAGYWWSGEERVSIAEEVRHAPSCKLCQQQKQALSPNAVKGEHESGTALPQNVIEVIHRVTNDSGRLSENWLNTIRETGLSDAAYVEIIGVIATTLTVDTYTKALDLEQLPLPTPQVGVPTEYLPDGLEIHSAWVPTIVPEQVTDAGIKEHYQKMMDLSGLVANIMRAMTIVPDEQLGFVSLMFELYHTEHALDKLQIELIATEVSALNECFY
ncbi:alkylhydroperoxidase-related (seleno)protein [Pseudalkalibacillus sp. SCS-8]|uniref:alkylhydroperoxidase-related (seleno)protein n=1 Tax=Pseudalkalibacillus nanhaiensis TaxID=3115291 RepID=UPI0032DAA3E2